ncbi:MAG: cyclic nucleotide-binding domain-containing protein [Mariprofundaceae bacterium]|nr:cyclic nucleotide-binding domain-containing protein [Mariprofundaceae bacterium]
MASEAVWLRLFRPKVDWVEDACALCEKNPLFEKVPRKSIRWLVSRMHLRTYKAGESIFSMGNAGAGAVLMLAGEVSVSVKDVELDRMQRGDLFGEVALATELPRTAEVVAIRDCELVFFLRSDLKEWLAIMPKEAARLLQNLSKMLAQRLMDKNKMITQQENQ